MKKIFFTTVILIFISAFSLEAGTNTECDLILPFACEVIGEGQSQQSGSWGPPVKCIDKPIAYTP